MRIPVVKVSEERATLFPAGNGNGMQTSQRSWVIQPDGNGRAILIPVNTLKVKVY